LSTIKLSTEDQRISLKEQAENLANQIMQSSKNFLSNTTNNNVIHNEIDMFKLTTDQMKTIEDK
jgi:hypothetical protein